MGVFGLSGYIKRKNPSAISTEIPENVYSVAIDFNADIYGAYNEITSNEVTKNLPYDTFMDLFFNTILKRILHYVTLFQPTHVLIIAVDGLPPAAKIQQQRNRRLKPKSENVNQFDTRSITPGTKFMFELDIRIRKYLSDHKDFLPADILYSSHKTAGEGEHKIMKYYRNDDAFKKIESTEGANILVSNDGDLIFLSILSPLENIYIYKKDESNVESLLSITHLKNVMNIDNEKLSDLILLATLLHNDFLPSEPSFFNIQEISTIIEHVNNSERICQNVGGIYVPDYEKLYMSLMKLSETSMERIENFCTSPKINKNAYTINVYEKNMTEDEFRNDWYVYALDYKNQKLKDRLETVLAANFPDREIEMDVTEDLIQEMAAEYLKGMIWNVRYYQTDEVNQMWTYPYSGYAPLLVDIAEAALRCNFDFHVVKIKTRFTILEQLAATMPFSMVNEIDSELKPLFSSESILLPERYEKWKSIRDGKVKNEKYSYTHPELLPPIDMPLCIMAVNNLNLKKSTLKAFDEEIPIPINTTGRKQSTYLNYLNQFSNRFLNTIKGKDSWISDQNLLRARKKEKINVNFNRKPKPKNAKIVDRRSTISKGTFRVDSTSKVDYNRKANPELKGRFNTNRRRTELDIGNNKVKTKTIYNKERFTETKEDPMKFMMLSE